MKYDITTLTLEEKLKLLTGRNSWQLETANGKLPDVFLSDGPNGLRMHDKTTNQTKKATAMPNIHVIANTWNPELAFLDGETIADDCLEHGADVLLAPGVNIKRTPLCGRNFEYFSEDPFLAGTLAKAYIEGVQSKGIGTSLKHYCANNCENSRFYQTSEIDERTLREIYLPAFEIAVQAQPWTVMCSYNPVNGVWASENKWLLDDILRKEFGFNGVIVSDWEAVHNSPRAAKATLDLRMPYKEEAYPQLKEAYDKGWLTEEEINARVLKILELMEKVTENKKEITTTKEERHANAVKIASEGIVLLKNEDDILPLKGGKIMVKETSIAPCYGGGGSAYAETDFAPLRLSNVLAKELEGKAEINDPKLGIGGWWDNDVFNNQRVFYQAAFNADTVVLGVGTGRHVESEGHDKTKIRLSRSQEDAINAISKYNENVIVVVHAGSAVDMSAWIDNVKAVVLVGFAGEGGQEALADVLVGKVNPSGKLSETFPLCLEDTPTGEPDYRNHVTNYREGVLVGYRYYDTLDMDVLFPFGHGLSYAKFEYSDLKLEKLGETDYEVSYTVTNVSTVDGKEVSQVYVRDVIAMVERPEKELKAFAKTFLKAGESKRVSHKLNARSFAYYSIPLKRWYVENGTFEILVGASSRDIRLSETLEINLPEEEQTSQI